MILNDYNKIINEHFDLTDRATRKCIVALEDSEQSQMLSALSSALYDKIVEKVDDIDFGSIPRSRGDITKIDGFDKTIECLKIMHRLIEEYHQDPTVVDNVMGAIDNIKQRKPVFMKAYALNIEFPMVLYNLTVAAIENSVSFLISVCIQYVKDPETNDMAAAIDRVAYHNAKSNLLYEQLVDFNTACANGSLDAGLETVMKQGKRVHEAVECGINFDGFDTKSIIFKADDVGSIARPFAGREPFEDPKDVPNPEADPIHEEEPTEPTGFEVEPGFGPSFDNATADDYEMDRRDITNEFSGILGAGIVAASAVGLSMVGLKAIVTVIIPLMRNITYRLIAGHAKIGACLAVQADFIEMNAYKLQTSDDYAANPKEMQKVVNKQKGVAERLRKLANKFAIDDKKAEKKAYDDMKKEGIKKIKIGDLQDSLPSEIYNKSVLF